MLYEVTVLQDYFGQQVVNRYNYLSSGTFVGFSGSLALLTAMGLIDASGSFPTDSLYGKIQDNTVAELTYIQALAKALYDDPTDFFDNGYAAGVIGQATGTDPMSPTTAIGFKTNRTRTDIARGTKRLAGVDESYVTDGGLLTSGYVTVGNDIADRMSETLSFTDGGSSATFAPVIVGKEMYTTPPAPKAYRYYGTLSEQLDHIAENIVWQLYPSVRTQTSRQYGHGA